MTRPAATLPWFLGISLAAHALLLVSVHAPRWGGNTRPPLAVRLAAPPAPAARPAAIPPPATPARRAAPARPARQDPAARVAETTRPVSPMPPATAAGEAAPAPRDSTAREAAARVFIAERLRHDIARYFRYPALARRKGWQGTVLLAFEISAQGHIRAVHVKRSSGHGLLDHSAVRALEQVERIEGFADRFAFRLYNVDLPVIYRLDS